MKKFTFKIFYSKKSLAIRAAISVFLLAAIILVIVFRQPISRKIYNWNSELNAPADFSVHYIDVGQGDSTLIELDDGKNMLIDCGSRASGDQLVSYIQNLGVETIDYFLLTHADEDHVGGGVKIFDNFEVKNFYRPLTRSLSESEPEDFYVHDTIIYDNVIRAFYEEAGAEMFYAKEGTNIIGENYVVKILYPDKSYSDTNATSAVLHAELGGTKFLFMGDAAHAQENKIYKKYGKNLAADVLKVGHHGAKTSTSTNFLSYVNPEFAIISAGKDNKYGHPTEEVINNLKLFGVTYFSTIDYGNILFKTKGNKIYTGILQGKMIDYALICTILGCILLIVWGIPDFNAFKREKEGNNKIVKK